jgi:hypothetical protein
VNLSPLLHGFSLLQTVSCGTVRHVVTVWRR